MNINAFATSCYWIMVDIKHLDRVRSTNEMTNSQPLTNTVRQHQLRFLGYILGMHRCLKMSYAEDNNALFVPTHDRKRPGR